MSPPEQRGQVVGSSRRRGRKRLQLDGDSSLRGGRVAVRRAQPFPSRLRENSMISSRVSARPKFYPDNVCFLALTVDAHGQDVALVGLELGNPRAAAQDDLRVMRWSLVGRLVPLPGGKGGAREHTKLGLTRSVPLVLKRCRAGS